MLMLCFAATGFIILPISHKIERGRKTNLMELHLNSLKTVPVPRGAEPISLCNLFGAH